MRIGNRRFSPSLWMTALYLLIGCIMLLLARWQMVRADEKIELTTQVEMALKADAVAIEQLDKQPSGYVNVQVLGKLLSDKQFLWDNQIHLGKAGFEVITPLQLSGGKLVLINRGWVPLGLSRQDLPDVNLPEAVGRYPIRLEGILTFPSRGFGSGDALAEASDAKATEATATGDWPKVLQYVDFDAISDALQQPLIHGLVQGVKMSVSAEGSSNMEGNGERVTRTATDSHKVLYRDNWQPVANGPAKHYGYAFQWFAMFFALTVLFVWLNFEKLPRPAPEESI